MFISDSVQITLITAMSGIITIIIPALLLYMTRRLERTERKIDNNHVETKAQIESVHNDVNGKMEKLIRVSGEAEKAKGVLEGKAEEKAKHADDAGTQALLNPLGKTNDN